MSNTGPRLELRQGQSLVMTQQLQQSIKLLQLSAIELTEFIDQELEKNPLLMIEGGEDSATSDQVEQPSEHMDSTGGTDEEHSSEDIALRIEESSSEHEERSLDTPDDPGWNDEGYDADYAPVQSQYSAHGGGSEENDFIERATARDITLKEHLMEQLPMAIADPAIRLVAAHLIDLVDEGGYIKEELLPVAELFGCSTKLVEDTLKTLQSFDPPGICARNLKECLALQLREKDRLDPAMEILLQHLELVGRGEKLSLQKICEVDSEDISEMIAEIKLLNPKPGHMFPAEVAQPLIPDVFLKKGKLGGWVVELNAEVLPRVLVNRRYYSELTKKTLAKQDKKYITDQLHSANWLMKALDQRAHTILRVSTELVAQQDGFFRHGISHLKPLTLKDIARPLSLHESTISRVTTNKYLSTARGLYKLKDFFTSGLQSVTGTDISSRSVQHMIKELIESENPIKPVSDDAIAEMLQNKGIDIARRTVAKYREEMKIPSSMQRRQKKVQDV